MFTEIPKEFSVPELPIQRLHHQVGAGCSAVFTSAEYRLWEVLSPSMRNSLQLWALQESNVAAIARIGVRDFILIPER